MKKQNGKPALTRDQAYALRSHTIKVVSGKFYASATLDPDKQSGPYKTLQACCAAIARKLGEEFTARKTRVEKWHGRRR